VVRVDFGTTWPGLVASATARSFEERIGRSDAGTTNNTDSVVASKLPNGGTLAFPPTPSASVAGRSGDARLDDGSELVEAADERVLSRVVARYGRLDLLLLDELGCVQIDPRGAELLFQIITEREERASIGLASNLPFSNGARCSPTRGWSRPFVDRITFNAHTLETGTQSYRLRTPKTSVRCKRAG
jgi:hypothetical protein